MYSFNEYQEQARRTQRKDLPLWALREHALCGLASEVGEVMSLHQKVYQDQEMDALKLMLEIGDCFWMLAELCDCYGFTMEQVARENIKKLKIRYKNGYTAEECQRRADVEDARAGMGECKCV